MQPRQHRGVAVGAADLDGVMLDPAVLGAEEVQPPGRRQPHRQARAITGCSGEAR
jgi:hypothetical protein